MTSDGEPGRVNGPTWQTGVRRRPPTWRTDPRQPGPRPDRYRGRSWRERTNRRTEAVDDADLPYRFLPYRFKQQYPRQPARLRLGPRPAGPLPRESRGAGVQRGRWEAGSAAGRRLRTGSFCARAAFEPCRNRQRERYRASPPGGRGDGPEERRQRGRWGPGVGPTGRTRRNGCGRRTGQAGPRTFEHQGQVTEVERVRAADRAGRTPVHQ